jgi:MFS family permease
VKPHPADAAAVASNGADGGDEQETSALDVFRNRPFLLLWLAQAFTQIGGNMVIYGLTVIILQATKSNTAVSLLILTFLLPAVLFSAVAGVYVDRFDRRKILILTNLLRAVAFVLTFLAGETLAAILVLNVAVSTITVFFGPAEAAMIPFLVPRRQLLAANGVFTLTVNAAFALGFALLGPIVVTLVGAPALILIVAACYLIAAGFCWTLPPSPPTSDADAQGAPLSSMTHDTEAAMGSTLGQLREGISFVRGHRSIGWSLTYLAVAASLVGVLGVLGPDFATDSLGLEPKDFVVVVLPLGFGIVTGILLLNSFGHLLPRRRIIEGGLLLLGVMLVLLSVAGPISRLLQRAETATGITSFEGFTSLLAVVVLIALIAGMAYAAVAIPAQTQLQEDLPEDVRGRVFGILNMLVSVASFAPILIVGPMSDWIGTTTVLVVVGCIVTSAGALSILRRGPIRPSEPLVDGTLAPVALDPVGAVAAVAVPGPGGDADAAAWRAGLTADDEDSEPVDAG